MRPSRRPADDEERRNIELELQRAERVCKMCGSIFGVVATIILLSLFSLVNGEPGSASYVVCILTLGLNALFVPYILYTSRRYARLRQQLKDALETSVLETMEESLARRNDE